MENWFEVETRGGEPLQAGKWTITLFVQSVRLRFPGLRNIFFWKRPVSVLAVSADGQEQILRVQDITRQVQLGLIAASLLSVLSARLVLRLFRRG